MSSVIETRPDIMWLSPSWQQSGDDPAIRIEPNGFTLNNKAREWVQGHGQGTSYIVVGMGREDDQLYLTRVGDNDYPRRVFVDGSVFQHWGLEQILRERGYAIGSTITFDETGDPNILAAYLTKRGL
jgi:hypothetical protein